MCYASTVRFPRDETGTRLTTRSRYGGHSEGETPGPIPNPEAKPFSADGTALARVWESRTPPDIIQKKPPPHGGGFFCFPHNTVRAESGVLIKRMHCSVVTHAPCGLCTTGAVRRPLHGMRR